MHRTADAFRDQPEPLARARTYLALEAGGAAQNLQVQATALGLGSVLVGGFQADRAARAVDLEESRRVLALLPVGWPSHDA